MHFNENKEDTNIDKEFKKEKKFDFNKYKKFFIISGIVLLALILIIIIISLLGKRTRYFITLDGNSEMNIYQGTNYNEPGYKGFDNKKNDLTNQVTVKDNIDMNTIGTYSVIYTLHNKSVTRKVNVVSRPDYPTTIHLYGDKNMYLKIGNSFTDPGCTAIDPIDGDLTDKVTINSNVDTSKKGIYRVVYSVVNSGGITTSETRTVVVE